MTDLEQAHILLVNLSKRRDKAKIDLDRLEKTVSAQKLFIKTLTPKEKL